MRALLCLYLLVLAGVASAGLADADRVRGAYDQWSSFPAFAKPGDAGMVLADLNADGTREVVLTGSNTPSMFVPVVEFIAIQDGRDGYRVSDLVRLPSGWGFSGRLQLLRGDRNPDRVVAALRAPNGSIELAVFGGKPLLELSRVPAPAGFMLQQVADVDGDGQVEALGVGTGLFSPGAPAMVVDLNSGALQWEVGQRVLQVRAGQLDADRAMELVLGTVTSPVTAPGQIVDGASRQVQWSIPAGFNGTPVLGNFRDSASSLELALVEPNGLTRLYQPSQSVIAFDQFATGQVLGVQAHDLTGDGIDELIVAQGGTGRLIAWSPTMPGNWPQAFNYASPDPGTSALVIGDLDTTPGMELVQGSTTSVAGIDVLRVLDVATGAVNVRRAEDAGPHSSTLIEDLDGDGSLEYLHASTGAMSGVTGTSLVIRERSGQELGRRESVLRSRVEDGGAVLLTANLDADPQLEIVIGSGEQLQARVRVVDGVTLQDQWLSPAFGATQSVVSALALVPAAGAGAPNLIAFAKNRLFILEGSSGAVSSITAEVGEVAYENPVLATGNVDADNATELLLGINGHVYIYDSQLSLERVIAASASIKALRIEQSAAGCEIVVATSAQLQRLQCSSGELQSTRTLALPALYVGFVTDSYGPLLLAAGDTLALDDPASRLLRSVALDPLLGWKSRGATYATSETIEAFVGGALGVHVVRFKR